MYDEVYNFMFVCLCMHECIIVNESKTGAVSQSTKKHDLTLF